MKISAARIASNSVRLVCVNHPEPPQQFGDALESQAKHLLDEVVHNNIQSALSVCIGVLCVSVVCLCVGCDLFVGLSLMKVLTSGGLIRYGVADTRLEERFL